MKANAIFQQKRTNRIIISALLILLVWSLINLFLVKISLIHFLIIELIMAFTDIISEYVIKKFGFEKQDESRRKDHFTHSNNK